MQRSHTVLFLVPTLRLGFAALAGIAVVGVPLGLWRLSPSVTFLFCVCIAAIVILTVWAKWQRAHLVREAPLPQFLKRKLREAYPHLTAKDTELVERGLRQYFMACSRSKRKFVAMPSKVVDAMWHEFILHTKSYKDWCNLALGRFLHHTPAEALGRKGDRNDGLRRVWFWACKDESINPRRPSRLPLLFALDGKLAIAGGFSYLPDCGDIARKSAANGDGSGSYCGADFASSGFGGSSDDFGGAEASSGDGGSDGDGGDGGGGCGGD